MTQLASAGTPVADPGAQFGRYIALVWRRRWVILGCGLAAGVAVGGFSYTRSPRYEAQLTLAVSTAKFGTVQSELATIASFRPYVDNNQVAAKVVAEFNLSRPPYRLNAARFLGSVLRIQEVRNTNLMYLSLVLGDAALAANVLNRVGQLAVELARDINQREAIEARDYIKTQLEEARVRLDDAQRRLGEFKRQAQTDLVRRDVDAMLEQRGGLLKLLVQIEAEKARLARAEQELASRQPLTTVRRTLADEPALLGAAADRQGSAVGALSLSMQAEVVNQVFESVDQMVAQSRSTLTALERQRDELVKGRKLDAAQLGKLTILYQIELEQARYEMEFDLARRIYQEVATQYEVARLQVASRSAQLQVLDPARPPEERLARGTVRKAALATILGAFLAAAFLVGRCALSGILRAAQLP